MHPRTQATIKRVITTAKAAIRAIGSVMAPSPRSMPESCININALLLHLCDFDPRTYRYVVKWLAYPLQNPGAKMQHSLMVNGQQGTGSALFFERVMAAIYGESARCMDGAHLNDRYNAWAVGARFLVVDGPVPNRAAGRVKELAAGESILVQRQSKPLHQISNEINMVFISHSEDFLPLSSSDRRFMVIEAPPAREAMFYKAVQAEIENGGLQAFEHFLKKVVNLADFNQFSEPPRLVLTERLAAA